MTKSQNILFQLDPGMTTCVDCGQPIDTRWDPVTIDLIKGEKEVTKGGIMIAREKLVHRCLACQIGLNSITPEWEKKQNEAKRNRKGNSLSRPQRAKAQRYR